MRPKLLVQVALLFIFLGVAAASLSAQQVEIYPNAGGFWPTKTDLGDIKEEGIYGVKAGVFLDSNFQLEGGLQYINHFDLKNRPDPNSVRSYLYDVNGSWNFGNTTFFGPRVSPYLTFGAGGLTTQIRHTDSMFLLANPDRSIALRDGDTFFTFNYGGGIKAMRLWGPVGLRADIRGRTIPNLFSETVTWPELTGGVIFTWGER